MPAFNRERYLRSAMESVLCQTFEDFELLIIDDGSTDQTVAIVESFEDPRIRLMRNETNLGIPRTRNLGIDNARGELLAWMDSDDVAYPQRLERQVAFLDAHPECALVGAWARWIDEDGTPMRVRRRPTGSDTIRARLLFLGCFTNTTTTARREILAKYRFNEDFALGSDVELWSRLARDHVVDNLPEVLVDHRAHSGRAGGDLGARKGSLAKNKHRVVMAQLDLLGVSFDDKDVERHLGLRTQKSVPMDASYLEWAQRWLLSLCAANRERGVFPEPAFRDAAAERWLAVCWKQRGARALGAALHSELTLSALSAWIQRR